MIQRLLRGSESQFLCFSDDSAKVYGLSFDVQRMKRQVHILFQ